MTRIEYKVALANATLCRWKALKIQNLLDIRSKNNAKPHDNITGPGHGNSTTNKDLQGTRTPRFHSWALLCLGTHRCYPNTNDVFHSPNYAKKPKGLAQDIFGYFARTNLDCRICRTLENEGEDHGELYTNHHGNSPTHCPQWTKMNKIMKTRTAKQAEYCTQCFAPGYSSKTTPTPTSRNTVK